MGSFLFSMTSLKESKSTFLMVKVGTPYIPAITFDSEMCYHSKSISQLEYHIPAITFNRGM